MNILIEDAERLEYLTSNHQWTKKPSEAKNFGVANDALVVARQELMGRFNIVGYFAQSDQLINMNSGRGKRAAEAGEGRSE